LLSIFIYSHYRKLDKRVAISQSNYIPWKGYFDLIAKADVFVIYDEVQYTKNDWRNRNFIKSVAGTGTQWLTIPVRQESLGQRIYDTKIISLNWRKKHVGSLVANYSKANFFREYRDQIIELYNYDGDSLSEINAQFIKEICRILAIDTEIIDSRDLELKGDRNERIIDACKKLDGNHYISGPAAQSYLDKSLFREAEIEVEWMEYSGYQEYDQLGGQFVHCVTILDLLFNTGARAKDYMKWV
jgi:hypothetical protein